MKVFSKIKKVITALIVSVAVFFSGQVFLPANFLHVKAANSKYAVSNEKMPGDYYANYLSYEGYYLNSEIYNNLSPYQYSVNNESNFAKKHPLSNDVFGWGRGSNILNDNSSLNTLIYRFDCLDPRFLVVPYKSAVANYTNNYGEYKFTLFKCNKDGVTSEKIIELYIEVNPHIDAFIIAIKRYRYGSEMLGISEFSRNVFNGNVNGNIIDGSSNIYKSIDSVCNCHNHGCNRCNAKYVMESIEANEETMNIDDCYFDVVYYEQYSNMTFYKSQNENINLPFYGEDYKFFYLIVSGLNSDDIYSDYYIDFTCKNDVSSITADYATPISSSISSIYSVCEDMYNRGHFNSYECGVKETVQNRIIDLLKDGKKREVKVSYLVQIGNTPFAKKVSSFVYVPVSLNTIKPSDVAKELGVESLSVGQSPCLYFLADSSGVFNAYYAKNVWLNTKTSNGNSFDYFLDINLSYYDYYMPFVNDSIMSQGVYEWLYSTICNNYPDITKDPDVNENNLYGYFGYCVIPQTYTIDNAISDMFNLLNMSGICRYFSTEGTLTKEDYGVLMDDYRYYWYEKAFNIASGWVSGKRYDVNHYFLYVDGKQDTVGAWENGASDVNDNNGAIVNGVEKALSSDFGKIFALVALVLLVVIFLPILIPFVTSIFNLLWFVLKTIIKFIWSILTFPFRLLKPK